MAKFKKGHKKVGGKKKGSKHKKTIEQEMALEILRKEIRKYWGELIKTKVELAKGIYVEKKVPVGKGAKKMLVIVYKKTPDGKSLEWLIEMVVGKPKESVEVSGEVKTKVDLKELRAYIKWRKDHLKDSS